MCGRIREIEHFIPCVVVSVLGLEYLQTPSHGVWSHESADGWAVLPVKRIIRAAFTVRFISREMMLLLSPALPKFLRPRSRLRSHSVPLHGVVVERTKLECLKPT